MKKINKLRILLLSVMCATLCGCNNMLDLTPPSSLTAAGFYKDDEQVLTSGTSLYSQTWYYFDNFCRLYTEAFAGNLVGDRPSQFIRFDIGPDNGSVVEGYNSLYVSIAGANTQLDNLERYAGPDVTEEILNAAKAEALFIRALAYFYLVRLWGAVPVVNDIAIYSENRMLRRTTVEGVYKFLLEDLLKAEDLALVTHPTRGRVCKTTCHALLAKVYMTLHDYEKAASYAKLVIDNPDYSLVPDYAVIGQESNDNGPESIFEFQWEGCMAWTYSNAYQAFLAFGDVTGVSDGWSMVQPSKDLAAAYEPGDLRRKLTIMIDGDYYPELLTTEGGLIYKGPNGEMNFRKYILGSPAEGHNVCQMAAGNNTSVLRLGDIYLLYAEAILANNATTTDAEALKYFNLIRKRAGLAEKSVLDKLTILKERRIELAVESEFWFDLSRIDPALAISIIEKQDRSYLWSTISAYYAPQTLPYYVPIPTPEYDKVPLLREDPVDYPN